MRSYCQCYEEEPLRLLWPDGRSVLVECLRCLPGRTPQKPK